MVSRSSLRLNRTWRIAVGAVLASVTAAGAQEIRPLTRPAAHVIDQWTTEDGLPQNSVNAITQGPEGYLWVGTFGGLARFDGTTFQSIERSDSAGYHLDRILSLAFAHDSTLWIGTEAGLLQYRNGRFTTFSPQDGVPAVGVTALHVDRQGRLWAGLQEGGVVQWSDGRFQRFSEIDGVPLDYLQSLVETADGVLWVNTVDRLFAIENGTPTARQSLVPPVPGVIRMLLEDQDGGRWFALPDGVLNVRDGMQVYGAELGVPRPTLMVEDRPGSYWIGTDNDGLFSFDPRDSTVLRHSPLADGRRTYRVRTAYVDLEGNAWFGTNAAGLLRAKRNLFTTYTAEHGLSHDVATAIYADRRGEVWAATNCFGVNAIDLRARTVRLFKPRRPNDPAGDPCVFSITESEPGVMWLGTYGGGVTRLEDGIENRLKYTAGLQDSVILSLFTDRDGTVWVGTNNGGVASLEGRRVGEAYTTDDGLAHNSVRTIYQTRDGALWIGTLEGLSRLAEGAFTNYRAVDGLSAVHIRALYEDADDNLWIGTYGGGLNVMRNGIIGSITTDDGLADDVVSSILEDGRGDLWMSGNRGIYRAPRRELVDFVDGRIDRIHSVLYGEEDGLLNAETNGGFQPASARDTQGRLWFPTVRGVAVVDPEQVLVIDRPPPVFVDAVVVDGVSQPPGDGLVVGPGRPNIEFRYTGISLGAPEHVTFRYRLDNFEDEWVEAGVRRVAYYPRLPPGRYRFLVTAANRDGVWNPDGIELAIRVRAPVWGTWWFRMTAVAGLLGLAAVVIQRREVAARRLRAAREDFSRRLIESQEHERKRLAGELHDGLGQDLLVVKNRALLALERDGVGPAAREQLEQITEVVGQSLGTVRGLAHNLTPYQLEHLGLSSALQSMIEGVADTAGLSVDVAVEDVDGLLPTSGEINLYRIVQEALNNVMRHARASHASAHIHRTADGIKATIVDDGCGFDVQRDGGGQLFGGFGLSGIAERVRILGGRVDVVSERDVGTRIIVTVPTAPDK